MGTRRPRRSALVPAEQGEVPQSGDRARRVTSTRANVPLYEPLGFRETVPDACIPATRE
ncbi:conserved hypothetical protein [Micrococcus luteus]|nr:conserved hypothetical protein [Micrococcus luteus]